MITSRGNAGRPATTVFRRIVSAPKVAWPRGRIDVSVMIVTCVGLAALPLIERSHSVFYWPFSIISFALGSAIIARSSNLGWGSLGAVFYISTGIFHLGLLPGLWLGLNDNYGFLTYAGNWLTDASARSAVTYVVQMLGVGALTYAAFNASYTDKLLRLCRRFQTPSRLSQALRSAPLLISDVVLAYLGFALSLAGAFLVSSNYRLLDGYQTYLTESNFERGAWGPFFMMVGWSMAISSRNRLISLFAGAVVLVTLTAMFLSGSRTFLFLAGLVALVVWVKRNRVRLRLVVLLVIPIVLAVASAARSFRDGVADPWRYATPLNSFYEFGSSLRPLVEMIRLRQTGLFSYDQTYINSYLIWPLGKIDQFLGVDPPIEQYGHGVNLLSLHFGEEYRFAFSNLADIYTNFNFTVGILFTAAVFVLIAIADRVWVGTSLGALTAMSLAIPILYAIRQPSVLWLPHLLFSAFWIAIAIAISALHKIIRRNGVVSPTGQIDDR